MDERQAPDQGSVSSNPLSGFLHRFRWFRRASTTDQSPPAPAPQRSFVGRLVTVLILVSLVHTMWGELFPEKQALTPYSKLTKVESKKALYPPLEGEAPIVGVIRFLQGDESDETIMSQFGDLVTELVYNKDRIEGVVVVVSSGGGAVTTYGEGYAQMERLRNAGLDVTVCVDDFAASGGYLMSLPANRIIAAPLAIIGSVGVVTFRPNVRGLLEKIGIEPREFTAGKNKRDITLWDKNEPEALAHLSEYLTRTHKLFKLAVAKYRPTVKMELIETGDHWYAEESEVLDLGLVDGIGTSDEWLLALNDRVTLVEFSRRTDPIDRLLDKLAAKMSHHFVNAITTRLTAATIPVPQL